VVLLPTNLGEEKSEMAIAEGLFKWDINQISAALKITPTDVHAYFTDGRRVRSRGALPMRSSMARWQVARELAMTS